ncbi:MAG: UvrD-helicase domain-containing protein [Planctomycetaceae bacterium]|jgi:DNA helicase-2/ATP-dependent DNA helicase PcrA
MIPLTDEQKNAVEYPDTLCLTSCPGSGKTRTIIAKLQRCIDEVRDTPRKIACITFTNTGVNEIEARLRTYGDRDDLDICEISTIHSFCLNYVLRPYAHLIPELKPDWVVITSDDEWFNAVVDELKKKYDIKQSLTDRFDGLQRQFPDKIPTNSGLPQAAVKEFFARADAESKVTLGDIVFFATKLVHDNPFIASALASRFAWFIVDEFQDTTVNQALLLYVVFRHGRSKVFFVGDPNQSILGFAGARPGLMAEFAKRVQAKCDLHLTGNFRSSKFIVNNAELLCPSNPKMIAVGEDRDFHIPPKYVHCATPIEGVFEHFLPTLDEVGIPLGKAAILAPWWTDLLALGRELRQRQIPIIGPGARPYKRSHEFTHLSEALSAYLMTGDAEAAARVQKALLFTLSIIDEVKPRQIYRFAGRRVIFRLILEAKEILAEYEGIVEWLLHLAAACESILIEEEMLTPSHRGVLTKSAVGMLSDMKKHNVDLANMAASELGMVAVPSNCLNLMTMHKSKGSEFEAVAVICVHEGRVPYFATSHDQSEVDQSRRLLYVAATRAKKILMYFTDQKNPKNTPSRFLKTPFLGMC